MLHRGGQGVCDAGDIAAELAGAVGFPLSDGAAADVAGSGQLVLRHAAGETEGADAKADGFGLGWFGWFGHGDSLRHKD